MNWAAISSPLWHWLVYRDPKKIPVKLGSKITLLQQIIRVLITAQPKNLQSLKLIPSNIHTIHATGMFTYMDPMWCSKSHWKYARTKKEIVSSNDFQGLPLFFFVRVHSGKSRWRSSHETMLVYQSVSGLIVLSNELASWVTFNPCGNS